ncbi:fimbria/pilus outer membrane usher protein [Lysobacter sp. KIS68-7]|uniref:fimbria/pilus outer membrane usher protein n=1 Tax=Lysobacter sp. KIS68-7 TaxID=2904252 RepID=UPI001E34AFDA|nr:fimbria/pilus outer membrane usher protein [Lysobacter sp. KIS68-7]UHQ21132.1 fimbria/pilus outer membrane usher protein [Lysobacter sp. KIS68-7]
MLGLCLGLALALPVYALPGDETLLLDLCINARCVGVAPVIARGDDVLVEQQALITAGIDTSGVVAEPLGQGHFISLRALNHGSTFAIDRDQLRLDLTLRPERLPRQTATMSPRGNTGEQGTPSWTAFANYAATVGTRDERNLFFDAAIGRGNAALRSTGGWNNIDGWLRGMTRFEYDRVSAMQRWTVGDQYAIARDPLGGGQLLGGVGVERAFDQDPYLVTVPRPYFSGVLQTPGTVEVYANGALIGRREFGAGPFTLEQLGIPPGRSDVRVIVRDPLGNRTELATQSYYGGSPRLLAKGLSEYSFRVGKPRTDGGFGNGDYADDTAAQGWYRRGLSDAVTLGGRIEGDDNVRNAGVDTALRTGFGEFAFAYAVSDADLLDHGHAYSANYSWSARSWSFGLGALRATSDYRALSDPLVRSLGTVRENDYAAFSFSPTSRLSVQLNAGRQKRDGLPLERSAGFSTAWRIGELTSLYLLGQRTESDFFRDTSIQLTLNMAFSRDNVGFTARHQERDGVSHDGYGFNAQRSRPLEQGFGYAVNVQREGGRTIGFGLGEYEGTHGRYLLEAERNGDDTNLRATATGAIVAVGGRVFATPPIDSSFALVRVPGMADVPVLRENQRIGRTDKHGDLLVRDMLPYYPNRLSLDDAAIPAGVDLGEKPVHQLRVARNTGSILVLDAHAVRAVKGHFRYAGQAAGDLAHVKDGDAGMPIGTDGLFYFETLQVGQNDVRVESDDGNFACKVDVPAQDAAGTVDLGTIACEKLQ